MRPNHYKFTGKERDAETNLDYFGARYYSNALGRFITPDWAAKATAVPYAEFADPQSLNLYSYVRNIPTAAIDVDGHSWSSLDAGPAGNEGGSNWLDLASSAFQDPNAWYPHCICSNAAQNQSQDQTPQVTVTYNKNVPAMQPKTQKYVKKTVAAAGVASINISATTNGKHALHSNHYNGTAVDINEVNGERVINSGKDPSLAANVRSIQNTANNPKNGVAHENYGPAGLFKDGKQITNPRLQSQHENHIHITIPRNFDDDN